MINYYLDEHAIMDYEFYNAESVPMHLHQNVELLAVMEGKMTVLTDEEEVTLGAGDYYVVNINRRHAIRTQKGSLFICLHINYQMLSGYVDMNKVMFHCNANTSRKEAHQQMQSLIRQIAGLYFARKGSGEIKLNILYYRLLNLLLEEFQVQVEDERFAEESSADQLRMNEITNYVYSNYKTGLSLNDLADHLYLSVAYLSKYIKKRFCMNFTDYVNTVRLYYAVKDLTGSDRKIINIAVDCGFPNLSAFNKAFKKIYNMTPQEYRTRVKEQASDSKSENEKLELDRKTHAYIAELGDNTSWESRQEWYSYGDARKNQEYTKYWGEMINIGRLSDLRTADVQDHVQKLKTILGFRYVRLWDIYSDSLELNLNDSEHPYNFNKMDRALDFLFVNNIYPYIEMGFKPIRIVEKLDVNIKDKERPILFPAKEVYADFLTAMFTHYVNRYGISVVQNWYLEQWKDPRLIEGESDFTEFFNVFDVTWKSVKKLVPGIKIGGGSIHFTYDESTYDQFLYQWSKREIHPDFITVYSYPYSTGKHGKVMDQRRSQNPSFLKNELDKIREKTEQTALKGIPVHVSEWCSSVSNRNPMNDSPYQAAYIVRCVLENIGNTQMLGYWLGSDLFSEYRDRTELLSGGVGLLSKNGIRKPSWYAFEFLSRLGSRNIGKTEHSIVTTDGYDEYMILCHNYKTPNYKYYVADESDIDIRNWKQYFSNLEPIQMNHQIQNMRNGCYQIRVERLNHQDGSVLDEWIRMGQPQQLSYEDMEYLNHRTIPKVEMWEQEVEDGVLNFETILEANEIQYIRVTYRL